MRHWSLQQTGILLLAVAVFFGMCSTASAQKGKGLENIKSGLFNTEEPQQADDPNENTGGQEANIDELNRSIEQDDEPGSAPAAKKERTFRKADGTIVTESQMKREQAEAAKKKNVRFGRPSKPLPDNWREVLAEVRCGNKKPAEAMRELGISRSCYYRLYSNN